MTAAFVLADVLVHAALLCVLVGTVLFGAALLVDLAPTVRGRHE